LIIGISPFLFFAAYLDINPSSKRVVGAVARCLTLRLKVGEGAL